MNQQAITEAVLGSVRRERGRQRALFRQGKIPHACEDPATSDAYRLGVLMEEVGEVGKAIHERERRAALYAELFQVAAVAVAWAESLVASEIVTRD